METMKSKISYSQGDEAFLKAMNESVKEYFDTINNKDKHGNWQLHLKATLLFAAYILCYSMIFVSESLTSLVLCYILMGPLTVFLALNIGHEAAHNIFCRSKRWNNLWVKIFDFLGASSQVWVYKHVHSHHAHTNVYKVDLELQQSEIVRIFPQDVHRRFHKFQHLYMPVLYCIYTLVWFCYRDFIDYKKLRKVTAKKHLRSSDLKFFGAKVIYISRMIVIPIMLCPFDWTAIILAFVIGNIVSSVTVTFALISTHVGEHSHFPEPDENGRIGHSWVRHQFLTTSDFSTNNKLVTALYGGFNHHLTHHLFPYVSHVHYPAITERIKIISAKFKVATFPQPSIWSAIQSHFKLLIERSRMGQPTLEWMEM